MVAHPVTNKDSASRTPEYRDGLIRIPLLYIAERRESCVENGAIFNRMDSFVRILPLPLKSLCFLILQNTLFSLLLLVRRVSVIWQE